MKFILTTTQKRYLTSYYKFSTLLKQCQLQPVVIGPPPVNAPNLRACLWVECGILKKLNKSVNGVVDFNPEEREFIIKDFMYATKQKEEQLKDSSKTDKHYNSLKWRLNVTKAILDKIAHPKKRIFRIFKAATVQVQERKNRKWKTLLHCGSEKSAKYCIAKIKNNDFPFEI